jgi:hypothetical protein
MNLPTAVTFRVLTLCVTAGSIAFGMTPRLSATNYYIDYNFGKDSNSGTSTSAAWKHCPGDPAATNTPAGKTLVAGDTVIFRGGVQYILTGPTGVVLRWSGSAASKITYDGNSDGKWGVGRALFTNKHAATGIAAFTAPAAVSNLAFKSLEIFAMGGTYTPPNDYGVPSAPRFGAGMMFHASLANTIIDSCVFHEFGYWYNAKPMNAASISGTGIGITSCDTVTISNSQFSRMAVAIEMFDATSLNRLTITGCTFGDSVAWNVDLPPPPVTPTNFQMSGCTESNNAQFSSANWTGYGPSPRTFTQSATVGQTVTLSAAAAASPAATFQWRKNGTNIAGATAATLTLTAVKTSDAGTYTAVATNTAGTATSNDAILTVTAASSTAVAPVITKQPLNQTVAPLGTATFSVAATGTPAPKYQWLKNGVAVAGGTNASLTISKVGTSDAATYVAVVTNTAGVVKSGGATLALTSASLPLSAETSPSVPVSIPTSTTPDVPVPPTPSGTQPGVVAPAFTVQPTGQSVPEGASVTFNAAATGVPTPTIQWLKDGVVLTGRTGATLTLPSVRSADIGSYVARASSSAGSVESIAAQLSVTSGTVATNTPPAAGTSLLTNLSVRGPAGSGSHTLMVGFVIAGNSSKSLLVRGVGPTLGSFGVTGALPDPTLSLFSGSALVATNSGWSAGSDATQIGTIGDKVGAFRLNDQSDAALLPTLSPGLYTAQITSATSRTGLAMLELYDPVATPNARLVNVSVRTTLGSGANVPIIGFVVTGNTPKRLLIRAVGPSLAKFGVAGPAGDPKLQIFQGSSLAAENDNWHGAAGLQNAFSSVGAFPLADPASRDAALIFTAQPGVYSAVISDVGGGQGVVLVELYELP